MLLYQIFFFNNYPTNFVSELKEISSSQSNSDPFLSANLPLELLFPNHYHYIFKDFITNLRIIVLYITTFYCRNMEIWSKYWKIVFNGRNHFQTRLSYWSSVIWIDRRYGSYVSLREVKFVHWQYWKQMTYLSWWPSNSKSGTEMKIIIHFPMS